MNVLHIEQGGMCATVQDGGRPGFRALGVALGGACDRRAAAAANRLVGNAPDEPCLEILWYGTSWHFSADTLVAICGANLTTTCRGLPFPQDRPVVVSARETLRCWGAERGNFAYLAIAGGIRVPAVLGGRGTHLQSHFGGWEGRAVRRGDCLPLGSLSSCSQAIFQTLTRGGSPTLAAEAPPWRASRWGLGQTLSATAAAVQPLRILPGPHFADLQPASQLALTGSTFKITADCSRMGFRLNGGPLRFSTKLEIASLPTVPGTLQVPPAGHPIALMADAAPTGGYPQVAYVITADLPRLAQADIGAAVRFQLVTGREANQAAREAEQDLRRLSSGIDLRIAVR